MKDILTLKTNKKMTEDEEEKCADMIYLALRIGFVVGFIFGCIIVGVAHI